MFVWGATITLLDVPLRYASEKGTRLTVGVFPVCSTHRVVFAHDASDYKIQNCNLIWNSKYIEILCSCVVPVILVGTIEHIEFMSLEHFESSILEFCEFLVWVLRRETYKQVFETYFVEIQNTSKFCVCALSPSYLVGIWTNFSCLLFESSIWSVIVLWVVFRRWNVHGHAWAMRAEWHKTIRVRRCELPFLWVCFRSFSKVHDCWSWTSRRYYFSSSCWLAD